MGSIEQVWLRTNARRRSEWMKRKVVYMLLCFAFQSPSRLRAGLSTLLTLSVLLLVAGILILDDGLLVLLLGSGSGPGGRARPLSLLPGTHIGQLTAALALASTAELLGEVLGGDLGKELLLVAGAEDVDLVNGDRVEEALDDGEDAAEAPGGVDDVQLAETLGVVVLRDLGGLADVAVDGGDAGDADALQVHDGAAGLEELAGLAGAGGQTGVGHLLVLGDEVLQHALGGGDLVHGIEVDLAQLLDVDGTAILWVEVGWSV